MVTDAEGEKSYVPLLCEAFMTIPMPTWMITSIMAEAKAACRDAKAGQDPLLAPHRKSRPRMADIVWETLFQSGVYSLERDPRSIRDRVRRVRAGFGFVPKVLYLEAVPTGTFLMELYGVTFEVHLEHIMAKACSFIYSRGVTSMYLCLLIAHPSRRRYWVQGNYVAQILLPA